MDNVTKKKLQETFSDILGEFKVVVGKRGAPTVYDQGGNRVSDNKLQSAIDLYNNNYKFATGQGDRWSLQSFKDYLKEKAEKEAKARIAAEDAERVKAAEYLKSKGIAVASLSGIDMTTECSKDVLICDALEYMDYTPNEADYKLFNGRIALTRMPDNSNALVIRVGTDSQTVKIVTDDDSPSKYREAIRKTLNTVKFDDGSTLLSIIRGTLTNVLQGASKEFIALQESKDFDEEIQSAEQNESLSEQTKQYVIQALENSKRKSINDRMAAVLKTTYPKVIAAAYMSNSKGISVLNDIIPVDEKKAKKVFHGFAVPPVEDVVTAARTCFGGLLDVIDYPKVFTNDRNTPCLNFFDLDTVRNTEGTCELWEEYFKLRITPEETNVIKAYLWSCVYAPNRSRQILFIWDDGHSGKSTFLSVLSKFFGSMAAAAQKDSFNNQFSVAKYWDKHIILFGDTGNSRLHTMDKVKSITGGDDMEVEQKGRSSFKANVYAHIIAASNTPLIIDENEKCETSRLIPIKFCLNRESALKTGAFVIGNDGALKPVGDANFEGKLLKQFPAFLKTCEEEYYKLCPKDADILLPPVIEERFKTSCGKLDADDEDVLVEVLREAGYVITDNINNSVSEQTLMKTVLNTKLYDGLRITPVELKKLLRKRGLLDAHKHIVTNVQRISVDYYADLVQGVCTITLSDTERVIIGGTIHSRSIDALTQKTVKTLIEGGAINVYSDLVEVSCDTLIAFANSDAELGGYPDYAAWINREV